MRRKHQYVAVYPGGCTLFAVVSEGSSGTALVKCLLGRQWIVLKTSHFH
jgi:hypothetical protein